MDKSPSRSLWSAERPVRCVSEWKRFANKGNLKCGVEARLGCRREQDGVSPPELSIRRAGTPHRRLGGKARPSAVQPLSRVRLFMTPWPAARQAPLSSAISPNLLRFLSIESGMPSNHPLLTPLLLPSSFPSIGVFSDESVLRIRRPKYWSFSFSTSPSSECSGLISFRMDCFDVLSVQGTLKSLL